MVLFSHSTKLIVLVIMIMILIDVSVVSSLAASQNNNNNNKNAIQNNQMIVQTTATTTLLPRALGEQQQQQQQQQHYNATDVMITSFQAAENALTQARNEIKSGGNLQDAISKINMAKIQIEQYQLASLDLLSNPVLQTARMHLLAAEDAIKTKNIDKAIAELNTVSQLRLLHEQGMMLMKLPMAGEMNSTFNSLEAHLLAANEAVNMEDFQKAVAELKIANDNLYSHQLSMIDFVNSLFNNTRTHLKQSISFLKTEGGSNADKAISELSIIDELIKRNEQGILMMIGISLANTTARNL
jgi:hypothetical protein